MIRRHEAWPAELASAGISRRSAITLGALGLTAGWGVTHERGNRAGVSDHVAPPGKSGAMLLQPQVLASRGGRLRIDLTAAGAVRGKQRTGMLTFNGGSPGPTLRVHPGDELAVRLINRLDEPTNLHTHGLRVSPEGNSDNPFLHIHPGTSFDYRHRIPADHPIGTFWYHPHAHGKVADQVFGGLFGALLVEPLPGEGPDLSTVQDRVLLISDISSDSAGRIAQPTGMEKMMGRIGESVLVNGQHQPSIAAAPGAPQRWRIINACTSRVLVIRLQDHDLVQIAVDGAYLPAPATKKRVVLAPGNRVDVLIHPTEAGRYDLTAEPYRDAIDTVLNIGAEDQTVTLATMTTAGPPAATPALPRSLPAERLGETPASVRRRITFGMGMSGTESGDMGHGGMTFTIDGRSFDPDRDDQIVALGTIEEWIVVNEDSFFYPFHLHTWPFTVLATSDLSPLSGVPQDVVLVPPNGWVRLRIPFTTHAGRSVFHCHILDHEDAGMMATVNVRR
ncbi:multicopper oxidase family protein [Sporichthya polymorpha]|uniref:multicopper oxidase family protein n=1 Tax=Sporichthya polymorpha TaxID=35751 RepID=UPI000374698B|nr:multicopper oxidase family protein [Sporichthya polymorpha]